MELSLGISTTLVVVEVDAGGHTGLGYSYSSVAITQLIAGMLPMS